ncbi:MAG: hypothetical protein AB8B65_18450 [Kordia sp.]|uniref:hypothetical protein n=1 Tax=Kordia sp. TaxID=1965332 RepID=UPI00385BCE3D
MFKKYYLIRLIPFCFVFFISCENEKKEPIIKKNTTEVKKDIVVKNEKTSAKTAENPIYKAAETLNMVLFAKELKYIDITSASKKIPKWVHIFNFKELLKIRAFKDPKFNKSYISDNLDDYVYFIFEYPTTAIALNRLQEYSEQVKMINKVEKDEISFETLSERQKTSFYNSEFGGIIFNSNNNIIYVKKSCSAPNKTVHMQWSTYEKIFLNSFEQQKKDSIIGTGCGFRGWDTYTRK